MTVCTVLLGRTSVLEPTKREKEGIVSIDPTVVVGATIREVRSDEGIEKGAGVVNEACSDDEETEEVKKIDPLFDPAAAIL